MTNLSETCEDHSILIVIYYLLSIHILTNAHKHNAKKRSTFRRIANSRKNRYTRVEEIYWFHNDVYTLVLDIHITLNTLEKFYDVLLQYNILYIGH